MSRSRPPQIFIGSRAWSIGGFALLLPTSLTVAFLAVRLLTDGRSAAGLIVGALGLFMLAHVIDWLARSIRPNRLLLDENGLTLTTWRTTTTWPWSAFRGIDGVGFQMLRVEAAGRRRAVPIGHWRRDLALHVHAFAAHCGSIEAGPGYARPSAVPLLTLSGTILLAALVFACFSLPR